MKGRKPIRSSGRHLYGGLLKTNYQLMLGHFDGSESLFTAGMKAFLTPLALAVLVAGQSWPSRFSYRYWRNDYSDNLEKTLTGIPAAKACLKVNEAYSDNLGATNSMPTIPCSAELTGRFTVKPR